MHKNTPSTGFLIPAIFVLFLSGGCKSDSGGKGPQTSSTSPFTNTTKYELTPEYLPATTNGSKPEEETGVLLEPAHFYVTLPKHKSSRPMFKLEPGTEVKIMSLTEGYYKVLHRSSVIGYIDKELVRLKEPERQRRDMSHSSPKEEAVVAVPSANEAPAERSAEKAPANVSVGFTPCQGEIVMEMLPGISCTEYKMKVLGKVSDLETYIKRIIDKYEPNRQKTIDLACRLFVNEQAQVYTSGLDNSVRARPIRKYLNGLMALSYDKVEIEWTNIQYVSDLRRGPDGRYFGYVQIEQRFEGYMDGRVVYGDITEKNITIVLEMYEIVNERGYRDTRWDIFLSDIGVEQTKNNG